MKKLVKKKIMMIRFELHEVDKLLMFGYIAFDKLKNTFKIMLQSKFILNFVLSYFLK